MRVTASNIKINVECYPSSEKASTFVFLLHGFTGSSKDWKEIIPHLKSNYSYVAIDLIGHGKSDSPQHVDHYKSHSFVAQLNEVFKHLTNNKFILIGYSMGGRAALSFAVQHPDCLLGLLLESASSGISDKKLREERVRSDAKIIKLIEEKSLKEFAEFWLNHDILASLKNLPHNKYKEILKLKSKNSKIGLMNSLKGFGTGVMPPVNDKLNQLKCKNRIHPYFFIYRREFILQKILSVLCSK